MEGREFRYTKVAGGWYVSGFDDDEAAVAVIPAEHDGLPVVGIARHAFSCRKNLKIVEIPETVRCIDNCAFWCCRALREVRGMEGVGYIGDYAFASCALTRLRLPEGLMAIGKSALSCCTQLMEVENLSRLSVSPGDRVFDEGSGLSVHVYGHSGDAGRFFSDADGYRFYEHAGEYFLLGRDWMCVEARLPRGAEGHPYSIAGGAFGGDRMETVEIPPCVATVAPCAFLDCDGIAEARADDVKTWLSVRFGNAAANPLHLGAGLVLGGETVGDLRIPDGTEKIAPFAFCGCGSVTCVTLPESLREIGYDAFSDCVNLTRVVNLSPLDIKAGDTGYGRVAEHAEEVVTG